MIHSLEGEVPSSQEGSGGRALGSYRPGRACREPDTLQAAPVVLSGSLPGLEAAAAACLAQIRSKVKRGEEGRKQLLKGSRTNDSRGNFMDSRDIKRIQIMTLQHCFHSNTYEEGICSHES